MLIHVDVSENYEDALEPHKYIVTGKKKITINTTLLINK